MSYTCSKHKIVALAFRVPHQYLILSLIHRSGCFCPSLPAAQFKEASSLEHSVGACTYHISHVHYLVVHCSQRGCQCSEITGTTSGYRHRYVKAYTGNIYIANCICTLNWDCSASAILGLTVLALGNCVADWVADTLVARARKPEMAFASCFGSPLLSHVIGLSVAMIVSSFIAAVIYMLLLHR